MRQRKKDQLYLFTFKNIVKRVIKIMHYSISKKEIKLILVMIFQKESNFNHLSLYLIA